MLPRESSVLLDLERGGQAKGGLMGGGHMVVIFITAILTPYKVVDKELHGFGECFKALCSQRRGKQSNLTIVVGGKPYCN